MKARYAHARKFARELLRDANVKSAPIPVERLAKHLGAVIKYEPFDGDLSGMVHRTKDGGAVIGVNSLHPIARRRFTLAHEIGHLLLHKNEDLHVDEHNPIGLRTKKSGLAVDAKEIEANQFAAELLMPQEMLAKDLEDLPARLPVDEAIDRLAQKYEVSAQAMTIRLSALGLIQ